MLKSEQLLANQIREFCYNYEYNEIHSVAPASLQVLYFDRTKQD